MPHCFYCEKELPTTPLSKYFTVAVCAGRCFDNLMKEQAEWIADNPDQPITGFYTWLRNQNKITGQND